MSDDRITVLTSAQGLPPTKSWRYINGLWIETSYKAGKWFTASSLPVHDIQSLGEAIDRTRRKSQSLVIRGEMQDNRPVPGGRVHRKKLTPAIDHGFADVPRRWFMVDIDSWPIPDNVSDDSSIEQILELAIATLLPAEFQNVTTYWQLSAGAGF